MSEKVEKLILEAASWGNILPLTSACNVRCLFCSHRQNPKEIVVHRIPPRTREQVSQALQFVDPALPVVIGESVTNIIEGEPLTHPEIKQILSLVRQSLPSTPVKITTNGILLDTQMADFLADLDGLTVYLSLNTVSPTARLTLMGVDDRGALPAAGLLKDRGITWHGSLVAMPHVVGWGEIEDTINFMAGAGAATIRIFVPGFTRLAPDALKFGPELRSRLQKLVDRLRPSTGVPLTIEPPVLEDLRAIITGVLAGSPAAGAGLGPGDEVLSVGGHPPRSRVDAFNITRALAGPQLQIRRDATEFGVTLEKAAGATSGLVMDYDLDPVLTRDMSLAARRYRASRVLVVTSAMAGGVMSAALAAMAENDVEFHTVPARNRFFGGSIAAAGLLTLEDMQRAVDHYLGQGGPRPELILLPPVAFDHRGRDLTGCFYQDGWERHGIPVVI